ncbi:hypothetical protein FRC17_009582 [Serendipita sp. 399]|nr:hypothetical protein FRC17_009582 [Serendipita sp. 399]
MSTEFENLCQTVLRQLDNVESQMITLEFGKPRGMGGIRTQLVSLRQDLRFTHTLAKTSSAQPTTLVSIGPIIQALTKDLQHLITLLPPTSKDSSRVSDKLTTEDWLLSWVITFDNPDLSQVEGIVGKLASSRLNINVKNKQMFSQLRPELSAVKLESVKVNYPDGEINRIVSAFAYHPFAISSSEVQGDVEYKGGIASALQIPSMQMGRSWLAESTTSDSASSGVINAEIELYRQLWENTVELLRKSNLGWIPGQEKVQEKYMILQDRLDQSLRDALLRQQNDVHTTVFVGGQHAGKSTLINGLLEANVLPVGSGPTTSLPCRIIHTPGQTNPLLNVDIATVNSTIASIRRMERATQDSHIIFGPDIQKSLINFNTPDYSLPSSASGNEQVQWLLGQINNAIRLAIIYKIGHGEFNANTWAVLRMEVPSLKEAGRNQQFEFVDIPGILSDDDTEFNWQSLTSEVIKTANVIVAVVASNNYDGTNWRDVPKVIDAGSNIRPTMIIATALDDVQRKEQERVKKGYIEAFWPESQDDPSTVGVYLTCSAELGMSAKVLDQILTTTKIKPPYDENSLPGTESILDYMFWGNKEGYSEITLENLIKRIRDVEQTTMLRETRNAFFRYLTTTSRVRYYAEEARGLSLRLQRITTVIEDQMIQLGLSPRTPSEQKKVQDALRGKAGNLRRTWAASGREARRTYKSLVTGAAKFINDGMEEGFSSAIEKASLLENSSSETEQARRCLGAAFIEFDSAASLQHFTDAIQTYLRSQLLKLQEEAVESLRYGASAAYHSQVASVIELVADLDPRTEQELRNVEPLSSIEAFEQPLEGSIDINTVTSRKRIRSRPTEFELMQERILQSFRRKSQSNVEGSAEKSLEALSPLLRALLAVISFFPFAFRYPFTSRIPASTRFRLDLSALRRRYKEVILQPWVDQFSRELQRKLQQPGGISTLLLEDAISVAMEASKQRFQTAMDLRFTKANPTSVQAIISNYCNLTAAQEALDGVNVILEEDEPLP